MSCFIHKQKTVYLSRNPVTECRPRLGLGGCGYFEGLFGGPRNTRLLLPLLSYSTYIAWSQEEEQEYERDTIIIQCYSTILVLFQAWKHTAGTLRTFTRQKQILSFALLV